MCRDLTAAIRRGAILALLGLGVAACIEKPDPADTLDAYRARLEALETGAFYETSYVVDRNGTLLAELAPEGHRTWVSLDRMAPMLLQAVIATEDRTFYENTGVDTSAVARAVLQNVQAGETVSGASTITMQLVRLVAFEGEERYEQTLERKVREAHLAAEVAERLSKDRILEAYLNIAYFGHGAYGAEAASQTYFGRSAADLSVAQASVLAGVLQAPANLDPIYHLAAARERQRIVLASLVEVGALSAAEAEDAWGAPLGLVPERPVPPRRARHFLDYLEARLPDIVGPEIAARGGYTVTTSLDLLFNERLNAIASGHVARLRDRHDLTDAAVVAVRPGSGEIVAMVGGVDYDDPKNGQVNVTTSPRQIGSAFKPITYAAAFDEGWTPADILWDVPLRFGGEGGYQPRNYDGRYNGPVRMRQALANSLNAAAVALVADIGLERAHGLAQQLGLGLDPDPWTYGLGLTLGGAEVALLDLTAAYAALGAGGLYSPPTPILRVERIRDGSVLYELDAQGVPAVTPQSAFLVTDILSDVEARQPAFPTDGPLTTSRPTAVKTGTTNDFLDNLTVGYTPYLAIGVWSGNKDGRPMRDVLGITGAAPVWHDAMEALFQSEELLVSLGDGAFPPQDFPEPEGIVRARVCDLRTLALQGGCREAEELFAAGSRLGDPGAAFGLYTLRSGPSAGGLGVCAVPDAAAGRVMLLPPHRDELAEQVRQWARGQGLQVAPPLCAGVSQGRSTPGAALASARGNPAP